MKKLICLVLVLACSLFAVSALADTATVSALGSATVTLEPDMATFTAGITTQDALITTAQSANATAMQAVLDILVSMGISSDDIQTDNYSVYPVYNYESDTPKTTGYEVSNTVSVTVRNLDQLPALLDAAVEAGANNVYSLSFQSSEDSSAYDQALRAATQDALRKATMMAQAIGKEMGAVVSLEEASTYSASTYTEDVSYALSSSYYTPIENGLISVSAQVVAVVEMQ